MSNPKVKAALPRFAHWNVSGFRAGAVRITRAGKHLGIDRAVAEGISRAGAKFERVRAGGCARAFASSMPAGRTSAIRGPGSGLLCGGPPPAPPPRKLAIARRSPLSPSTDPKNLIRDSRIFCSQTSRGKHD